VEFTFGVHGVDMRIKLNILKTAILAVHKVRLGKRCEGGN